jgi:ribosomal protein L37AE/L43A
MTFGPTPKEEATEKELRDGYRAAKEGYEPDACKNCNRQRVELCRNGKRICEKCHWDQGAHQYDGTHREMHG